MAGLTGGAGRPADARSQVPVVGPQGWVKLDDKLEGRHATLATRAGALSSEGACAPKVLSRCLDTEKILEEYV